MSESNLCSQDARSTRTTQSAWTQVIEIRLIEVRGRVDNILKCISLRLIDQVINKITQNIYNKTSVPWGEKLLLNRFTSKLNSTLILSWETDCTREYKCLCIRVFDTWLSYIMKVFTIHSIHTWARKDGLLCSDYLLQVGLMTAANNTCLPTTKGGSLYDY
jgi:hypothetical protein